jgi:hypothetical protein
MENELINGGPGVSLVPFIYARKIKVAKEIGNKLRLKIYETKMKIIRINTSKI